MKNFAVYFLVISAAHEPMRQVGWATGYALSIYGTIPNNVHLVRVMVMAMVEQYLYLKESSMDSAGKCN